MNARIIYSSSTSTIATTLAGIIRANWPTAEIEVQNSSGMHRAGEGFPARLIVIVDGTAPDEVSAGIVAIRRVSDFPLVVFAPQVSERYEIEWLHLGADEVIGTVSAAKFLAIIEALVRRTGYDGDVLEQVRTVGDLSLKIHRHELLVQRKDAQLTATEFRLLAALSLDPGRPVPLSTLAHGVWGADNAAVRDSLKVHMSHLRHKLAAAGSAFTVVSERGIGYSLSDRGRVTRKGATEVCDRSSV